jgi:hypothetical protein
MTDVLYTAAVNPPTAASAIVSLRSIWFIIIQYVELTASWAHNNCCSHITIFVHHTIINILLLSNILAYNNNICLYANILMMMTCRMLLIVITTNAIAMGIYVNKP